MNAWREFWHVTRWDLVQARWWALGSAGLVALGAFTAANDSAGNTGFGPAVFIPMVWMLVAGLGATTLIQADSPIVFDRFFRGKPLRAGLLPVSKSVAAFALFILPALLVMLMFYVSQDVPREAIVRALGSILSSATAFVALFTVFAMVTTHPSGTIALLIGAYLATALLADALQGANIPTVPIGPLLIVATVVLVLYIYRRPVERRAAQLGAVVLLALSPLSLERGANAATASPPAEVLAPGGDSIRLTIDSTSVTGSAVRVAFHIDSRSAYDGHVLRALGATARSGERPVQLFAVDLVPPNTPTSLDKVALVRFDPAGGASYGSIGTLEMLAVNAAQPSTHRVTAVAVFAASDTSASLQVDALSAWVFAYRWRDSVTVPVRVGQVWAARGERVRLDTVRMTGQLRWRFRQSRPFTTPTSESSRLPARALGIASGLRDDLAIALRPSPTAPLLPTPLANEATSANMFAVPGAMQERREGDLTNRETIDPGQARLFLAHRMFIARVRVNASSTLNLSTVGAPRVR